MDGRWKDTLDGECIEVSGSNFDYPRRSARYRLSRQTVSLREYEVPQRIESLRVTGEWEEYPSVFVDPEFERAGRQRMLVLILKDGGIHREPYDFRRHKGLLEEAKKLNLTNGSRSNWLQPF